MAAMLATDSKEFQSAPPALGGDTIDQIAGRES